MSMKTVKCDNCGGDVVNGKQIYHHRKKCSVYKEEGVDHVVCQVCGYRSAQLNKHIKIHGLNGAQYREMYPDSPMVIPRIVHGQNSSKKSKGGYKPVSEKRGAKQCPVCDDWYQPETAKAHRKKCVNDNPDAYVLGRDYVRCPECDDPMLRLGRHLKDVHGWDEDKVAVEKSKGLQLTATIVTENRLAKQDMEATKAKREATNLKRYGVKNAGGSDESRKKAVKTSRRRYGQDHAMQTEAVRIRQYESAQSSPSKLEAVFDSITPDNVVYTGYGARFIHCQKGVRKYGRVVCDLNPDFMVFADELAEEAQALSAEHQEMERDVFRSGKVVELLGDYYHSEDVIGVPSDEHERDIIEAYASVGIDCLVLWEHDVLGNEEKTRTRVLEWLG